PARLPGAPGGRGGRGSFTLTAVTADAPDAGGGGGGRGGRGPQLTPEIYKAIFKDPAQRDPRVFVVPANQADFATATKFINTMRYVAVRVLQASAPFSARGKTYPPV